MCICILGWQSVTYHFRVTVPLTSDLVFKLLCPEHISFIILDRIPKFGVWVHLGMMECRVQFMGHYDLDLWPSFKNNRILSISLILLKVGIPNLVCGCIFGWGSVTYHFRVTLTFDLVCRIIVSRTYLLYYLKWESQVWVVDASRDGGVLCSVYGSL